MLTEAKLNIYREYGGWWDGYYIKHKTVGEGETAGEDWTVIEGLLQDLLWIRKGLADTSYQERVEARIKEICDGPETIAGLIALEKYLNRLKP